MSFDILYTASVYCGSLSYYGKHISVQDTSLRSRFKSEYLGFYCYLVIRNVAMCQFSTSDESFQNHHFLAGTRVTVKLFMWAGPSGQLFELAIKDKFKLNRTELDKDPDYNSVNHQF
jgi:hypothetical protein